MAEKLPYISGFQKPANVDLIPFHSTTAVDSNFRPYYKNKQRNAFGASSPPCGHICLQRSKTAAEISIYNFRHDSFPSPKQLTYTATLHFLLRNERVVLEFTTTWVRGFTCTRTTASHNTSLLMPADMCRVMVKMLNAEQNGNTSASETFLLPTTNPPR
jgi:hypothetical protein